MWKGIVFKRGPAFSLIAEWRDNDASPDPDFVYSEGSLKNTPGAAGEFIRKAKRAKLIWDGERNPDSAKSGQLTTRLNV